MPLISDRTVVHAVRDAEVRTAEVFLPDDEPQVASVALRFQLRALLDQGPAALVVDLSGHDHLSSDAIDVLLWLRRRCAERAVPVVLRQPSRRSMALLRRSGLLTSLTVETLVDLPPAQTATHRERR